MNYFILSYNYILDYTRKINGQCATYEYSYVCSKETHCYSAEG